MPEWISVEERLPGAFDRVLGCVYDTRGRRMVRECYTLGGKAFCVPDWGGIASVSHWMPMPKPPEE